MKFFRSIRINGKVCPRDIYLRIVQMKPEGRRGVMFYLEAKPDDFESAKLVERIAALCRQHGVDRIRGAYSYSAAREYEATDLQDSTLLFLAGGRGFLRDVRRNESGFLVVPAAQASASLKLKAVFPTPWIVVSDVVRELLGSRGLIGLDFREVIIKGQSRRGTDPQLNELRSEITLPGIVNAVRYADSPYPCYGIDDDSYQRPEIHYRQSELQTVGNFDIAHTKEALGHKDPSLIISQRFHQHCLEHKIPLTVWPVRIDPT